jgi:elongation factor Ts
MKITSAMVQALRDMTGAAMMDCKKALEECGGDVQQAVDHLRKKGAASAAKKATRETAEGRVFACLAPNGKRVHMVAVGCETDFLAKSERFLALFEDLQAHVAANDPTGIDSGERALLRQAWKPNGRSVAEALQELVGLTGENVRVAALTRVESAAGWVGAYVHHDNKQGAVAAVAASAARPAAEEFLRRLCQHVVVYQPPYLDRSAVPAEALEREKAVIQGSEDVKRKPAEHQDKIVQGKLSKFYAGACLGDQPWILDDKLSVQQALEQALGRGSRLEAFHRIRIGG